MTPYEAVESEVVALYGQGDYDAALRLLERNGPHLADQWERLAYWRVCLLARSGRPESAIDTLAQAVEAGAWWAPRLLETEDDLDLLWSHDAFRRLIQEMENRRRLWNPTASGLFVGGTPGGTPYLGMHGRNQVFEVDAQRFTRMLGPEWEVAVPESDQRIASDGPVWDDPEASARQVTQVADRLWGPRPFALGGYSQGGRRALQIGLRFGGRIPGVMAVSPMLLRGREMAEVIEALGQPPWPRVFIVCGEKDPATPNTRTVIEHLRDEGVEADLEVVEGASHMWLEPSRSMLTALEEVVVSASP